jgi:hypothetical protein
MEPQVTEGRGDVRACQSLVQRIWTKESTYHIGDLAWERFHLPQREASGTTAVWREGDCVLGWAMIGAEGELHLQVDPAWPALADVALEWVVGRAGRPLPVGDGVGIRVPDHEGASSGGLHRAGARALLLAHGTGA